MWVKMCGNTRLEDSLAAAELGADAVGFVFAAGKRTVTASQVAAITAHLPAELEKIGVFTTVDADEILQTARAANLTGVQLHGALNLRVARALRSNFAADGRCRVVQVLHWWTDVAAQDQQEAFAAECEAVAESGLVDALLIDSRTRDASGGTGKTFDWEAAQSSLAGLPMRVIVAGGLRPENVGEAVRVLLPWGVDVSSGVESAPGAKDQEAIARFIANARGLPDGLATRRVVTA